jgi:hypothetical protein
MVNMVVHEIAQWYAEFMSLDRPVLITGTPRAGKTLVARMFATAPEFFWLSEPKEIWDIGLGHRKDDRRTAAEATPEVRAAITQQCEKYLEPSGRARYVDELARHALRTPFIFSVLPDVRLILVVRHPRLAIPEMIRGWQYRDSVRRKMRRRSRFDLRTTPTLFWRFAINYVRVRMQGRRATWGPTPPGLTEFATTHSTAEIAAFQWAALHSIALDDLEKVPSDQWLLIRYDDLVANLQHEAERIANFAQINDIPAFVSAAEQIIDPNWTSDNPPPQPTDTEWSAIRRIVEPVQQRLGYGSWMDQERAETTPHNGEHFA